MQHIRGCPACRDDSSTYICAACLTKLLGLYRNQTASHINSLLPAARTRAKAAVAVNREHLKHEAAHSAVRTDVAILRSSVKALDKTLDAERRDVTLRRQALDARRSSLLSAREALANTGHASPTAAHTTLPSLARLYAEDKAIAGQVESLYAELAETRRILVAELAEAYEISVPDGGSAPSIVGLPVPPIRPLAVLPKHQLNATIQALLSFMRILAFYLGIRLPFQVAGSMFKPTIRAISGQQVGQRLAKSHPLYVSSKSSTCKTKEDSNPGLADTGRPAQAQLLSFGLQMLAYNFDYLLRALDPENSLDASVVGDDILRLVMHLVNCPALGSVDHVTSRARAGPLDAAVLRYPFAKFAQDLERQQEESEGRARRGTYIVVDDESQGDIDPFVLDKPIKEEEGWDLL